MINWANFEAERENAAANPCCRCERDEVCGCDCHWREQDPDLLYDAWRDKQDEEMS